MFTPNPYVTRGLVASRQLAQQFLGKPPEDYSLNETQQIRYINDYLNDLLGNDLCLITCLRKPTLSVLEIQAVVLSGNSGKV